MRFPKTVSYHKAEARIYGKKKKYPYYRVYCYVAGKPRMSSHRSYSEALQAAEELVRNVAKGNQSAALSAPAATRASRCGTPRMRRWWAQPTTPAS